LLIVATSMVAVADRLIVGDGAADRSTVGDGAAAVGGDAPHVSHKHRSFLLWVGFVFFNPCKCSEKKRSPVSSTNTSTFANGVVFAPVRVARLLTKASSEWL